jgi:alanyl-tRNA synthetase
LYQTHGVPPELFEALAAEHNLTFDWDGYSKAMAAHGETSGKARHVVMGSRGPIDSLKHALHSSEFLGYKTLTADATIKGIVAGKPPHDQLCDTMDELSHAKTTEACPVRVVLDRTPFHGESGGQVGDRGVLRSGDDLTGEDFEFEVTDTQKDGGLTIHYGHLRRGTLREGARVRATVDTARREAICRAHSATHLLHYALQKNLGSHAQQQGSKVDEDWLRFDFTNLQAIQPQQLANVNLDVSQRIEAGETIASQVLPLAEARAQGAMMLFGEKYPDPVRMVTMGSALGKAFSKELCGGTHLDNTAQIAQFEILGEEGISAGTRRITALTGLRATEYGRQIHQSLQITADLLGCSPCDVPSGVARLQREQRDLKKMLASGAAVTADASPAPIQDTSECGDSVAKQGTMEDLLPARGKQALAETAKLLSVSLLGVPERVAALRAEVDHFHERLTQRSASGPLTADHLLEMSEMVDGVSVIIGEAPTAESNLMRQLIDQIRQKVPSSAVLLASTEGTTKVTLVAGISQDLQARGGHAGNWIRPVAQVLGGGGGGRPDMAQAGGKRPDKLPEALEVARQTIIQMLQG